MMPISLRRANMPMRSVFATRAMAEASMMTAIESTLIDSTCVIVVRPIEQIAVVRDVADPRFRALDLLGRAGRLIG